MVFRRLACVYVRERFQAILLCPREVFRVPQQHKRRIKFRYIRLIFVSHLGVISPR